MNPREVSDARRKTERLKLQAVASVTDLEDLVDQLLVTIEEQHTEIATLEARVAVLEAEAAS